MTPQTVKDLAELGMTPEALAEKTRQVEASLYAPDPHDKPGEPSMQAINSILGRTRQPRSDKGTTRPPKPKPAASCATDSAISAVEALMHERAMLFLRISEIDKALAAVRKVVASFDSVSQSSK